MEAKKTIAISALAVAALTICSFHANADEGESWALLIGADNYQVLGKLEYCGADARALAEVLRTYAGFENVAVLTDADPEPGNRPTRGSIRRAISTIAEVAGPDDTIFVFFSGHGIMIDGRGYLVPTDGDATAENAISMDWVRSTLLGSKAARRILIIDACHAGSGSKGIGGIAPDMAAANLIMLMSSAADQLSYPNTDQTHSIFTKGCVAKQRTMRGW